MIPWAVLGTPPATVAPRSLLAFWQGGASFIPPSPLVGVKSMSAFWMGGAGAGHGRHLGNLGWGERRKRKPLPPVERVQRIADEMRALYASIYERARNNAAAAEETAALVARYAPTSAPDFPPPNVIDWEMIAEEGRVTIAAFREALIRIQQMLAEQDDEDAILVMLLAD